MRAGPHFAFFREKRPSGRTFTCCDSILCNCEPKECSHRFKTRFASLPVVGVRHLDKASNMYLGAMISRLMWRPSLVVVEEGPRIVLRNVSEEEGRIFFYVPWEERGEEQQKQKAEAALYCCLETHKSRIMYEFILSHQMNRSSCTLSINFPFHFPCYFYVLSL